MLPAARPSAQTIVLVRPRVSRLREAEERAPIGIHQQALADGQGARKNDAAQRLVGFVDRVELHIGGIGERLARGGVEFGRRFPPSASTVFSISFFTSPAQWLTTSSTRRADDGSMPPEAPTA